MSLKNRESIAEVYRSIVKTYNSEKKRRDLVLVRYLYRPCSFPLTVPFIKIGMSANQGTLLNFAILVTSIAFLCVGSFSATVVGAILYLLIFVTDCIDGNIARYRKQRSYFGKVADGLVDTLVYYIFIAIAIGSIVSGLNRYAPVFELAAGASITLSMLTISYFRARIAYAQGEIALIQQMGKDKTSEVGSLEKTEKGKALLSSIFDIYQNLGPAAPIIYAFALWSGRVSEFLVIMAFIYILFTVAEIIYVLYRFKSRLNVRRETV